MMTSVSVVDRSSLDVKSLGRKMIERWSEQNMRGRDGDEVEGIERDSKRQESKVYKTGKKRKRERAERERESERDEGREWEREEGRERGIDEATRSGAESKQRKMYLAQGVDKHSLPLGSILLFLKIVARWLAHR